MTLLTYFDSSVLMKLYIDEAGSEEARGLFRLAALPVSSVLANVEVVASLHRARAGGRIKDVDLARVLTTFRANWARMGRFGVDAVAERAVEVASRTHLKGADAIHLATCLALMDDGAELLLACADGPLAKAAGSEGVSVRFISG